MNITNCTTIANDNPISCNIKGHKAHAGVYFCEDENSINEHISTLLCCSHGWTANVLVTDFVPSEIACLASSPGRINRTAV